jgi:MYXO-CTERM domain-containing protein
MKKLGLVGIVLLVGCGGGSGSSTVTIQSFPQKYAEALCAKNFGCCDAAELSGKTMATCVDMNETALTFLTTEIQASQAQGRASFDPKASGTCVDSLKAMTCEEFKQGASANMTACMALIMPKVAMGGACTQPYECTTGNCEGADTTADPVVDGTCAAATPVVAVGASCAGNAACVEGAYCDFTTTTCQPRKGVGETCTSSDECTNSCDDTTGKCTCYAGCQVAAAATPTTAALSVLLLGAGLVIRRRRRR